MQAQGLFRSLHSRSAIILSLLFLAHASSPAVRDSRQLPQAGQGWVQWSEQQSCSLLARALRVSRRMKRWLSLLLRLACSRDATREAGEQERRRKWREKNRSPGGGALLYPPPTVIPGSSFKKSQVPGPLGSMGTAGPSQGGQSLCMKHTPEHLLWEKERGVEEIALDLLGSE